MWLASAMSDLGNGQPSPLGRPSYSRKQTSRQTYEIGLGGRYARVHFHSRDRGERREWKRGKVQAFSARSRSRLLQSFAQTDFRGYDSPALWVTLTYHHEWADAPADWKRDVEELWRRIRRRYPHAWGWWRLELQRRGAPHYHLIVFGVPESYKPELGREWEDIAGACCEWCRLYMARVDTIKTWEQAAAYLSKYAAKVEQVAPPEPGRYWGIAGRANRTVRIAKVEVSESEAFRLRRMFRRLIRAANGYYRPGGSRSGVWVQLNNRDAKRALAVAASALDPTVSPPEQPVRGASGDGGMPACDIATSSRVGWPAASRTTIDRTTNSTRLALFDSTDLQARRAGRLGG